MEKQNVPANVYLKIVVGLFFCSIILSYFCYRLLFEIIIPTDNTAIAIGLSVLLSIVICSLLVEPSIQKEMEKADEQFSIVAKNPNVEVQEERFTKEVFVKRFLLSMLLTFLLSIPLTLVVIVRLIASETKNMEIVINIIGPYKWFYILIMGLSFFIIFIFVPSLKDWHWSKPQF